MHYVSNYAGSLVQAVVGGEDVPTGENLILSAAFFHGDRKVAERQIKTQLGAFAIDVSGEPYVDLEREAAAMLARE